MNLNEDKIKERFFKEFSNLGTVVHDEDYTLIVYDKEKGNCYKIEWHRGSKGYPYIPLIPFFDMDLYFYLELFSYSENVEPLVEKLRQLDAKEVTKSAEK